MTVSVALTQVDPIAIAGANTSFTVTVTNGNAAAVTLLSLTVNEVTQTGCTISQANYLTPNVPVGVGNPVINAGTSSSWNVQVIFPNPYSAGPSPNNAPGGAAGSNGAYPANANVLLQVIGNTSDGSVFSNNVLVPVLSTIAPFPVPQGGAFQFASGFDFVSFMFLGAL